MEFFIYKIYCWNNFSSMYQLVISSNIRKIKWLFLQNKLIWIISKQCIIYDLSLFSSSDIKWVVTFPDLLLILTTTFIWLIKMDKVTQHFAHMIYWTLHVINHRRFVGYKCFWMCSWTLSVSNSKHRYRAQVVRYLTSLGKMLVICRTF